MTDDEKPRFIWRCLWGAIALIIILGLVQYVLDHHFPWSATIASSPSVLLLIGLYRQEKQRAKTDSND